MVDGEHEDARTLAAGLPPAVDAIEEGKRIDTAGNGERDQRRRSKRREKAFEFAAFQRRLPQQPAVALALEIRCFNEFDICGYCFNASA